MSSHDGIRKFTFFRHKKKNLGCSTFVQPLTLDIRNRELCEYIARIMNNPSRPEHEENKNQAGRTVEKLH